MIVFLILTWERAASYLTIYSRTLINGDDLLASPPDWVKLLGKLLNIRDLSVYKAQG